VWNGEETRGPPRLQLVNPTAAVEEEKLRASDCCTHFSLTAIISLTFLTILPQQHHLHLF
jgi:hypothetical protein